MKNSYYNLMMMLMPKIVPYCDVRDEYMCSNLFLTQPHSDCAFRPIAHRFFNFQLVHNLQNACVLWNATPYFSSPIHLSNHQPWTSHSFLLRFECAQTIAIVLCHVSCYQTSNSTFRPQRTHYVHSIWLAAFSRPIWLMDSQRRTFWIFTKLII